MGFDYALVHATYTIPPAIILALLYAPLCTRLDLYKLAFLITIAVVSTIPWDSYLIRTSIWSYPSNVVLGITLFDIPIEEVFFFVIQTFITSLLYLLLSKPLLHPLYLVKESSRDHWRPIKIVGQVALGLGVKKGIDFVRDGGDKTYLGLILIWAGPFLFLLWSLAYQLLVQLPPTSTIIPIALPTLYLWVVDTLALKRGTWVIETGTKTGWTLWPGLEIEEALFFLLTNTLIVWGLVAFDNAVAVLTAFPAHFPRMPSLPSPALLIRALLLPSKAYDDDRLLGLQQAIARLKRKSRSFYLASSTFQGRLRVDLILLYSFCRVADDLIDNASSAAEAKGWVSKLKTYLDLSYSPAQQSANGKIIASKDANQGSATLFVVQSFPPEMQLSLLLLPTSRLSKEPLYELVRGLEMDLSFSPSQPSGPIKSEADLDLYSARVAGTVALLCIELALHHHSDDSKTSAAKAQRLMAAGHDMGIALQCTNIARDFTVDARAGRCYVPPAWLKKEKLSAEAFVAGLLKLDSASGSSDGEKKGEMSDSDDFFAKKVELLRSRLLDKAAGFYTGSVAAIEELPGPARAPMRVAVESYMQIARELRNMSRGNQKMKAGGGLGGAKIKDGRATVPLWLRVWVAWRALLGPRRGNPV